MTVEDRDGIMYVYRLKRRKAWLVKQKPFQTRSFSDARYGGVRRSKAAAIAYRNQRDPNMPHPLTHATNTRNTSGKVGVSRYTSATRGDHLGWIAFWWEGGRQKNVRFPFKLHGRKAYRMAVACREEAERRLAQEGR